MIQLVSASVAVGAFLFATSPGVVLDLTTPESDPLFVNACLQQRPAFAETEAIFKDSGLAAGTRHLSESMTMLHYSGGERSASLFILKNGLGEGGVCTVSLLRGGSKREALRTADLACAKAETGSGSNSQHVPLVGSTEVLNRWREAGVEFAVRRTSVDGVCQRWTLNFSGDLP